MLSKVVRLFPCFFIALLFITSCAKERTVTIERKKDKYSLSDRYAGGYKVGKDEQGNPKMISDKVSSFDPDKQFGKKKSTFSNKRFSSKNINHKEWQGARSYQKKAYQSNKDGSQFAKKSRFDQSSSKFSGRESRESNNDYATNNYKTGNAREGRKGTLDHVVDAETSGSRRDYTNYEIIDQSEYKKRSIQETRSLLGRE